MGKDEPSDDEARWPEMLGLINAAVRATNDVVWFGDGVPQLGQQVDPQTGDLDAVARLRERMLQPVTSESPPLFFIAHPDDVDLAREMLPGVQILEDRPLALGPASRRIVGVDGALAGAHFEVVTGMSIQHDRDGMRSAVVVDDLDTDHSDSLNREGRRAHARGKDPSRRWRRRKGRR